MKSLQDKEIKHALEFSAHNQDTCIIDLAACPDGYDASNPPSQNNANVSLFLQEMVHFIFKIGRSHNKRHI